VDSREIEEKKNTVSEEVTKKYRKVFLTDKDGEFVLTDILNELGDFSFRPFKTEENAKESVIKSNLSKLILWKLGVWNTANATKITKAKTTGKTSKGIIGKIIRLPWKNKETEEKDL